MNMRVVLPALVLALAFLAGCGSPPPAPAEEEERAAPVKAAKATSLKLAEITSLIGATEVVPQRMGRISTPVEGRVLSVLGGNGGPVAEGQEVKAGDIIAQLDDRIVKANREKTRLSLEELAEQKKQADLTTQTAQVEVDRLGKLRGEAAPITGMPMVAASELTKAQLMLADAHSKRQAAELREQALRKELMALDLQAELYTLRAPIDGRLGTVLVAQGQTLTVGTAVADVVDLTELEVLCFVPPSLMSRLSVGQPAEISVPGSRTAGESSGGEAVGGPEVSEPRAPHGTTGKVVFISAQANPDTGNLPVELRFANPKLEWRAGTVARVEVETRPAAPRLTIPEDCLMEDTEPPGVVVVTDVKAVKKEGKEEQQGKARRLRAAVGVRDHGRHVVEILSLTDPGGKSVPVADALFVTEGWPGLRDDDLVKVEAKE